MRANGSYENFSYGHEREHQRQQERLKAMAATSDKVHMVSADQLIENLLKDPFNKLLQTPFPVTQLDHSNAELPAWLQCESDAVPSHYKYLWSLVHSKMDLADTQKVSQLLLTSGLQVDLLGFIWNLANKKFPGQLTKQEFYIVLALVSLAQSGCTFNNLSVLKLMTIPLIPVLQGGLLKCPTPQSNVLENFETPNIRTNTEFPHKFALHSKILMNLKEKENSEDNLINNAVNVATLLNDFKKNTLDENENDKINVMSNINFDSISKPFLIEQNIELCKKPNFPCIGSSPTTEFEDDFSAFQSVSTTKTKQCASSNQSFNDSKDDFTDFQSAVIEHLDPFKTVVVNQKKEPKIQFPKAFHGKFSNLKSSALKISPETEKKLKILSQSESLSSLPESKITSSNKVSTSLSVLGRNHEIDNRLATHTVRQGTKVDRKFHKHCKINLNSVLSVDSSSEDEVILRVKPRNLETVIPKHYPKNTNTCKTFILKETKIRSEETDNIPSLKQIANDLESSALHSGQNTRQIEIPMLGTFNETVLPTQKSQTSTFDLIAVQEDKYSALRDIDLEINQEKNSDEREVNDDFGDFLSADIPINFESECSSSLSPSFITNSNVATVKGTEKDDWGDWNFSTDPSYSEHNSGLHLSQTNTDIKAIPSCRIKNDLSDIFTSLVINTECDKHTSQPEPFLQEQHNYLSVEIKGNKMNDIIMLNEKYEKLDQSSVQSQEEGTFCNQADDEFWEFLNTNIKHSSRDINRHSSLSSLDLKISAIDETEQEIVWRKCLNSCHNLIQEGYEIFNNINTKYILDEVFAAPKTEQYLNNLNIVFHISKRVTQNFNNFPLIQGELEKFWFRLQDLCFEYNIKLKHDEDNCSERKVRCNICLRRIGYSVINEGTCSYHPSCANLWINCIDPTLPSLI